MLNRLFASLLIIASIVASINVTYSNDTFEQVNNISLTFKSSDNLEIDTGNILSELNKENVTHSINSINLEKQPLKSNIPASNKDSVGILIKIYNGLSSITSFTWNGISKATSYALSGASKTLLFAWNNDIIRNTVVPIAISGATSLLLSELIAGSVIRMVGGVLKPAVDHFLIDGIFYPTEQLSSDNKQLAENDNTENKVIISLDRAVKLNRDSSEYIFIPIITSCSTSFLLSGLISGPVTSRIGRVFKPVIDYHWADAIFKSNEE
ncbi:MAG: hypothetical protein IJ848_00395 [Alphaproteobacteria bacterium]|nr:hypothetical protein [Alphaproteobacteria bacterium]